MNSNQPKNKSSATISLIQRLLARNMTFDSYTAREKLKNAEGRRLQKFSPEPEVKKEKK